MRAKVNPGPAAAWLHPFRTDRTCGRSPRPAHHLDGGDSGQARLCRHIPAGGGVHMHQPSSVKPTLMLTCQWATFPSST